MDEPQPARRRFPVALIAILVAGFLVLGAVQVYQSWQAESDPRLLAELEKASLETGKRTGIDWPQWRGPRRDGISAETGLLDHWPESGPKILWEAKTGGGYSSLAVSAGRVFTLFQQGGDEVVVCWDANGGKELWRHRYPARYPGDYGPGPRSTPTVDGDRVYTLGGTGILHCLAVADGRVLWQQDLLQTYSAPLPHWGVACSPLVEGDQLIAIAGGPDDNSVVSLNKLTGQLRWKSQNQRAGYSSPIAADLAGARQLLIFNADSLLGLSPEDGKLLWGYSWQTMHGCNIATPIAAGDFVFISSGYGKGCAVLKVVQENGQLDVQRVYRHTRMKNHFSSSVLWQDHLYGFDEHTLTCLDFRSGEVRWRDSSVGKGSLILADGQLILLGETGKLVLAPATPEGYRPTAEWQFSANRCWSLPVLANGKLFVRDEQRLVCIRMKKD